MKRIAAFISRYDTILLAIIASIISMVTIWYYFVHGEIIAYGDAESHLNIAKRVVDSLTPGLAQLGGIWLPLPHLLMVPFVLFDPLWRSGLAGSIVSGLAFVVSAVYLYKFAYLLIKQKFAGIISFLVFVSNPNILYMQATPMTEMLLVCFFVLSTYYLYKFFCDRDDTLSLLNAAFFGFAATLTRYDGWFLVLIEAISIAVLYFRYPKERKQLEGKLILFATLAFFGIALWMLWNLMILGNPLYFTDSPFSAKSQQHNWIVKGELPTYKNLFLSIEYYAMTVYANISTITVVMSALGLLYFWVRKTIQEKLLLITVLFTPFIFYVVTLVLGQSVIFIPSLTPAHFEWNLFNVRYGLVMIPTLALLIGVFASWRKVGAVLATIGVLGLLALPYFTNTYPITLTDGTTGLSAARIPDAEYFMQKHYDGGLVLMDDYARTMSIVRSGIPMRNIIYVGNKPYWDQSLIAPEKYADWIVMQKNDAVWKSIYANDDTRGRLFKYFNKVYTSPNILIFEKQKGVTS